MYLWASDIALRPRKEAEPNLVSIVLHREEVFDLVFPAATNLGALWHSELSRMIARVTCYDDGQQFQDLCHEGQVRLLF